MALADELGSQAVFVSTDVTSEDSILAAIEQAIAPGTIMAPIMESVGEEAIAKVAANVPFPRRLGAPNGYVNGEVLRLDGAQRFTPK